MNVTEANDTHTLLRWLLGIRQPSDVDVDDQELTDAAEDAAVRLAGRARGRLSAGLSEDDVRDSWQHVEACPWQDAAAASPSAGTTDQTNERTQRQETRK